MSTEGRGGAVELRIVSSGGGAEQCGWVWRSKACAMAKVRHIEGSARVFEGTKGYGRLLAACRVAILDDKFWAVRYGATTLDVPWLLEVLVSMERNPAHELWCPALVVMLGLMTGNDEGHFTLRQIPIGLRRALDSGSVMALSDYLEAVDGKTLANIQMIVVVMLARAVAWMAIESRVLGASGGETLNRVSMWRAGEFHPAGPVDLAFPWHEDWAGTDPTKLEGWDGSDTDDEDEVSMVRVPRRGDERVEAILDECQDDVAVTLMRNFRPIETPHHRAEIILVRRGETPVGCVALEVTATFETEGPSHLRVHVFCACWNGDEDDTALERLEGLVGAAIGEWASEIASTEFSKVLEPRSEVLVHVTPEPGTKRWDDIAWAAKSEVHVIGPDDDGGLDHLGGPMLAVMGTRADIDCDGSPWPMLGVRKLTGKDAEVLREIEASACSLGMRERLRGPISVRFDDDGNLMTLCGYADRASEVVLSEASFKKSPREDETPWGILIKKQSTKQFIAKLFSECGLERDDGVLGLWWTLFGFSAVFSSYSWSEPDDWQSFDTSDETTEPFAWLVTGRTDAPGDKPSEWMLESFWNYFRPQLHEVVGEGIDELF
ncbi:hypothetical protein [Ottowia sp.]|uniref:hypothetical protein n=1 Tax=Ottowia sp. TaxID=1898956 RepID=UPI0025CF15CD|nr:hypothetical protein [Ottowia sp.]MBK6616277.1 hypothetical protein [Ottowia sp.]